jgi:pseudouridine-5'-phosphate glycosidase
MAAKWSMGLKGGVVVANPIPAEAEIAADEIAPAIAGAVKAAEAAGIAGKQVTPYLLKRLVEATAGRSLEANIALVNNNAKVAAQIAVAYAASRRTR